MQMLIKNPDQRIKPDEALAHKYFNLNGLFEKLYGLNKKQIAKKGTIVNLGNLGQTINNQHHHLAPEIS